MMNFVGENGTIINYNSDLSGQVRIVSAYDTGKELEVSGEDLLEFVAEYVRNKKIASIEQMDTEELLQI